MKVLFINSCIRKESRTKRLAEYLISRFENVEFEFLDLNKEKISPLSRKTLEERDRAISEKNFSHPMFRYAKQFAEADIIVMAAPFWDLSFPALLRSYIEAITVNHVTFRYSEKGIPEGLCKGEKLYYVTTAGGFIGEYDFGYKYVKTMAKGMYGIPKTTCIKAEGLDIYGADVEGILREAEEEIDKIKNPGC